MVMVGNRKQNILLYLYEGMLFLSSRIAREDRITIDGKQYENYLTLLSLNADLQFGYFSTHGGYVTFCKRLFCHGHEYDIEFLGKLIQSVAQQADLYEMRFVGYDRH